MARSKRLVPTMLAMAVMLLAEVTLGKGNFTSDEPLPEVELRLGMHHVVAELAATEQARAQGLMYRTTLPAHRGMLFAFPTPNRYCMWMKNTLIPLAVAFLDDDGHIVHIEEMAPLTLTNHCSPQPVRWALEMPGGWFQQRGIGIGMRVEGLPAAGDR